MKKIIRACSFTIWLTALYLPYMANAATDAFDNPVGGVSNTMIDFVKNLLQGAVTLSIPFVAVYIIYSGFLFVFAQGNQEKLSRAKENFMWVIFGSALVLGAWMFALLLSTTVDKVTGQQNTQKICDRFGTGANCPTK